MNGAGGDRTRKQASTDKGLQQSIALNQENEPEKRVKAPSSDLSEIAQKDPNLAKIVTAWPSLPEAVKAGIVAMVKAAGAADSQGGKP